MVSSPLVQIARALLQLDIFWLLCRDVGGGSATAQSVSYFDPGAFPFYDFFAQRFHQWFHFRNQDRSGRGFAKNSGKCFTVLRIHQINESVLRKHVQAFNTCKNSSAPIQKKLGGLRFLDAGSLWVYHRVCRSMIKFCDVKSHAGVKLSNCYAYSRFTGVSRRYTRRACEGRSNHRARRNANARDRSL